MRSKLSTLLLLLICVSCCWAQPPGPPATPAKVEDVERVLGPFQVGPKAFTVTVHEKQIRSRGKVDPDFGVTVAAFEIRDAAGTLQYQSHIPYDVQGDRFAFATSLAGRLVKGKDGEGLMLEFASEPSTPLGGGSFQIFGLFESKLVPFSKPLSFAGNLVELPTQSAVQAMQLARDNQLNADVMKFEIWTGNFFAVVPIRVHWQLAKVMPAWRCQRLTAMGPRATCPYDIKAERTPMLGEMTFVRLFQEPEELGLPEHVVIKRQSKVEFLKSECELIWSEGDDAVGLSTGDDCWVKVRIDGKEGWIHTQEDLQAIGLPQAG